MPDPMATPEDLWQELEKTATELHAVGHRYAAAEIRQAIAAYAALTAGPYEAKPCRGHWHVYNSGYGIMADEGSALDEETAKRAASRMNARLKQDVDHWKAEVLAERSARERAERALDEFFAAQKFTCVCKYCGQGAKVDRTPVNDIICTVINPACLCNYGFNLWPSAPPIPILDSSSPLTIQSSPPGWLCVWQRSHGICNTLNAHDDKTCGACGNEPGSSPSSTPAMEQTSYDILKESVEKSLQSCIVEDDVAEEAIYAEAIETAGVAISEADDIFHSIRTACARDLARKHNATLKTIIALIDGEWEASIPFARLHEARRGSSPRGETTETET